jgi:predicted site-specific integrase-resolvase
MTEVQRTLAMDAEMVRELLPCALVARLANVTTETVRSWDRRGVLKALRTASGMRLFRREDVDALIAKRAQDSPT